MKPHLKARYFWTAAASILALIAQDARAAKLTLNPASITLDTGSDGIPGRLADEQSAAGDPRAGDRPDLTSNWVSTSGAHINAAIIDLGANYEIARIYLYDTNGSGGDFTVTAGSPTSGWTNLLASNTLNHYKVWKGFPNSTANDGTGFVDDPAMEYSGVTTRYLRVVNPSGLLGMPEIVVYTKTPAGPTDVAQSKAALGSSNYDVSTPASAAVDGNAATGWRSEGSARPYTYLEVDLGGYFSLSRFDLEIGTTTGSAPSDFEIQTQNEGCWQTVPGTAVTGHPSTDVSESFTLGSPIVTNKVRFVCKNGGSGCRVRTFAAIGVASTKTAAAAPSCGGGTQVVRRSPSYDYAEFLPGDYDNDPDQTFPLIIALHGVGGETVADDRSAIYSSPEGLAKQIKNSSTFRSTFPAITVSPHCRNIGVTTGDCNFTLARLEELWRDVMSTYRVDPDRIYMTGLSGGALATNKFALYHYQELAAILPIAGNLQEITPEQKAFDAAGDPVPDVNGRHICDMKQLPILAVHGTQDGHSLTRAYRSVDYQNIMNVKCSPTYPKMLLRLIVGGLHTGSTWDTAYADSRTYDWLFAQRASDKADPATHSAPVVTPSANQTVTLPTDSANFNGSATDSDGTITKYSWINVTVNGDPWPTVADNLSSASSTLSASPAGTAGTYKFRLIATDDDGFTGFKDVTLTVK